MTTIKKGIILDEKEIEELINYLDKYISQNELCVYPEKQTYDCCDCYLCRIDYFRKLRKELMK